MKNSIIKTLVATLVILMAVTSLSLLSQTSCNRDGGLFGNTEESPLKGTIENAKVREIQKVFRKISELYGDRVVSISTEQTVKVQPNPFFNDPFFNQFFGHPQNQDRQPQFQKRQGLGSGFIISRDGYVCTNNHVIKDVDKITVKVNQKNYNARVVGSDEKTDVALLKINSNDKFLPVFIGNSDQVETGDWVIAIGNPFGLNRTFTMGVVSATGRRDVDMMGGSQTHIQTDASINPGNSGGPLINIDGEVIGINRMIYSNSGGYMGIGFAIPINQAKSVLEHLKKFGKIKRGYIGVQIVPFTEDYAKNIGLSENNGALVGAVVPGSPAEKGGILVGDIIRKINEKTINTYDDLIDEVEKAEIGKTLRVDVWRNKLDLKLFITVKERK